MSKVFAFYATLYLKLLSGLIVLLLVSMVMVNITSLL